MIQVGKFHALMTGCTHDYLHPFVQEHDNEIGQSNHDKTVPTEVLCEVLISSISGFKIEC